MMTAHVRVQGVMTSHVVVQGVRLHMWGCRGDDCTVMNATC